MEYRVLARKYRPASFSDLVGQEELVRTLSNAIRLNRVAHAFLLTGIRGIGKTTTARIIARALNCVGQDGQGGATTEICGVCAHCKMIAEDRHPDVIEMDAASHTGVNDIRDLIETVRYLPSSARSKIYIIDEVHMLSNSAFNALLKTLEEPPPHVKFVFATTEVRKIPVTILSRCQRFDLKRLDGEMMASHLGHIAGKEAAKVEAEALALLAIAAEGSVRDGLSLLDRAIAQCAEEGEAITAARVRAMLGLADKTQSFALLNELLAGNASAALSAFDAMYRSGADPLLVLQDLLELVHYVTRVKLAPEAGNDAAYAEHERKAAQALAPKLSMPVLTRLWQMLLKGVQEARSAPSPLAAAEMALARIAYAADLPTPAEIIAQAQGQGSSPAPQKPAQQPAMATPPLQAAAAQAAAAQAQQAAAAPAISPQAQAAPSPVLEDIVDFPAMVALFERKREPVLAGSLRQFASLVAFAPGSVELHFTMPLDRSLLARMGQCLKEWTGREWKITLSDRSGESTLDAQARDRKEQELSAAARHPMVSAVMQQFPEAALVDVV